MWFVGERAEQSVTCPACGETVTRSAAREYDKYGDRWDRENKEFEYFCKPCHDSLCLHDRRGLESLLSDMDAGSLSQDRFLATYRRAVSEERDQPEH